ncbi:MAG: hypothetical protein FWH14_01215 [Oscillospiraceae bacterium]|nr:hypothetical protein [Oscillospiraceae bacterium]
MAAVANTQVSNAVIRLKELSADERTRMLYESRIKMERDIYSITKGKEETARNEGLQQGIQQGMRRGMFDVAKKLLQFNRPINEIATATNLTPEEIESLLP